MAAYEEIVARLADCEAANAAAAAALTDTAALTDYAHLVRRGEQGGSAIAIWTDALAAALAQHQVVTIPAAAQPYYIDGTVTVPSHRRIVASPGACICLTADTDVLMLRNAHTLDGTHAPISGRDADCNISIEGGVWAESRSARAGYGSTGKYDAARSFYGVSTCMLFNHIRGLTLRNMTFAHTAGFAVQIGDAQSVVCADIRFESCYADGLHINGNTRDLLVRRVSGQVGDDLVALNMYDWQDSSVNFGPLDTALVEDLTLSADSPYKAMRIEPGAYIYDDGSRVDCAIHDLIVRRVRGIHTFKLYYQTPRYRIGEKPEPGAVGSAGSIWFEDIAIDLAAPVDLLREYTESDPVRGRFAAFEVGANIQELHLKNIDIILHRDAYPLSHLLGVGPKSCIWEGYEIFDPYISCRLAQLTLQGVTVNGRPLADPAAYIYATRFEDINADGASSGSGVINTVTVQG